MYYKAIKLLIPLILNVVCLIAASDSIGLVTIDGEQFITYEVEKGEGLSAVARKYNLSIKAIKKVNGDSLETLYLGQIILIPLKNNKNKILIYHKVDQGETLFGISQRYNISIEDLKNWNGISTGSINPGDKLKIMKYSYKSENNRQTANKNGSNIQNDVQTVNNPNEIYENGAAGWLQDASLKSKKSLALHGKAGVGTTIRVTNLLNNKTVYVKVVGKLPKDKNPDTIIMLSGFAASKIDFTKKYTRVKLYYLQDSSLD